MKTVTNQDYCQHSMMQYSNVYVAENLLNDVNRMSTLTAVLLNNKQSNGHVQTVIHCSIQAFFSKKQCCSSEGEGGFVFQTIHKQNYKFSWRDILILWGECPPPPSTPLIHHCCCYFSDALVYISLTGKPEKQLEVCMG